MLVEIKIVVKVLKSRLHYCERETFYDIFWQPNDYFSPTFLALHSTFQSQMYPERRYSRQECQENLECSRWTCEWNSHQFRLNETLRKFPRNFHAVAAAYTTKLTKTYFLSYLRLTVPTRIFNTLIERHKTRYENETKYENIEMSR